MIKPIYDKMRTKHMYNACDVFIVDITREKWSMPLTMGIGWSNHEFLLAKWMYDPGRYKIVTRFH